MAGGEVRWAAGDCHRRESRGDQRTWEASTVERLRSDQRRAASVAGIKFQ
jgi:hypothetical protein